MIIPWGCFYALVTDEILRLRKVKGLMDSSSLMVEVRFEPRSLSSLGGGQHLSSDFGDSHWTDFLSSCPLPPVVLCTISRVISYSKALTASFPPQPPRVLLSKVIKSELLYLLEVLCWHTHQATCFSDALLTLNPATLGPEAGPSPAPCLYPVHQLPASLHLPFRFLRQDLTPTLAPKTVRNAYQVNWVMSSESPSLDLRETHLSTLINEIILRSNNECNADIKYIIANINASQKDVHGANR